MKALYISAASIALVFGSSARADDDGAPSAGAEPTALQSNFTWTEAAGESSLLSQAKAVFAALRQRAGADAADQEVAVVDIGENLAAARASTPEGNCERMQFPGSRIRGMRCYTPSEGEQALNDYQFQEEMRQIRDQQAMRVMERTQLERVVLEASSQPRETGGIR